MVHGLENVTSIFQEMTQVGEKEMPFSDYLSKMLEITGRHTGLERLTLCLLDTSLENMHAIACYGLNPCEMEKARYRLGEGITGRVCLTGQPAVVRNIAEEPCFLNKTQARDKENGHISFLCVPVTVDGKVHATLSADRESCSVEKLREDVSFLQLLAYFLAPRLARHYALTEKCSAKLTDFGEGFSSPSFVTYSEKMREVIADIQKVAPFNTTVLIRGESGTGKEVIANLIYQNSARSGKPFIKINCAALPENLIESELFGYEKGAFTGADQRHKGKFELCHTGTIFLDELGDMSLPTQAKLLRVLQEKQFERVGGTETLQVDVRIIAATNKNLEELVAAGKFREDLFYRLSVFPIFTVPLRERREDIIPLAYHFIRRVCEENNRDIAAISPQAIEKLMQYRWTGNVRELANVAERAVILCGGDGVIGVEHLPRYLVENNAGTVEKIHKTLEESLEEMERRMIVEALGETKGNIAKSAGILGITERVLGLRMKKYGLEYKNFRV